MCWGRMCSRHLEPIGQGGRGERGSEVKMPRASRVAGRGLSILAQAILEEAATSRHAQPHPAPIQAALGSQLGPGLRLIGKSLQTQILGAHPPDSEPHFNRAPQLTAGPTTKRSLPPSPSASPVRDGAQEGTLPRASGIQERSFSQLKACLAASEKSHY